MSLNFLMINMEALIILQLKMFITWYRYIRQSDELPQSLLELHSLDWNAVEDKQAKCKEIHISYLFHFQLTLTC